MLTSKKLLNLFFLIPICNLSFGQGGINNDTTRINVKQREVLIIKSCDTIKINESTTFKRFSDGNWSGIDMGLTMLMNPSFQQSFPSDLHLQNDPAKSFQWNLNLIDRRLNLYKNNIGITTGLGFSFTGVGIKDNRVLGINSDSLFSAMDTVISYKKNKLNATYLQIPLLLEFNTTPKHEKSFHFLVGVVGGVRIGSRYKLKDDEGHKNVYRNEYALSPFKLDATLKVSYSHWGIYASYGLISMFDKQKATEVAPFSFGLSFVF